MVQDNPKSNYPSSWTLPPTPKQVRAIARLAQQLGIKEPLEEKVSTRWEARQQLHELNKMRKLKK